MSVVDLTSFIMLVALVIYVLSGGADFGGGVWDLLARGPRKPEQRKLIEHALAPVWEANHVWLIFIVVVLFACFPRAFAAVSTALHVPLTLMLLGIVFRGSAFVFRQYGGGGDLAERRWGRVFAVASVGTPICLGVVLGSLAAEALRLDGDRLTTGFITPWLGAFQLSIGLLSLALFAFLAAVYLTVEARTVELADDFRRRALASELALGAAALIAGLTIPEGTSFGAKLWGSVWTWPLQIATALAAVTAMACLWRRRFAWARLAAMAQAALIVLGFALAQRPYIIAPDLTFAAAAAPPITFSLVLPTVGAGALILIPSLYWLLRVFKRGSS